VRALGSGVDPEDYRLSLEAGAAYTEKAKLELICRDEDTARLVKLICLEARTGHRGDGIIAVVDVERCVKVRTGDENQLALL
jgi:nitrogen regulatory protein P-II 1